MQQLLDSIKRLEAITEESISKAAQLYERLAVLLPTEDCTPIKPRIPK